MTSRQATVLVSDELTYSLNGKLNLFGVYTGDISIVQNPTIGVQLIFLFIIETSPDDLYRSLHLNVTLPGGDARDFDLAMPNLAASISDKARWCLKYPLLFANPILFPGPIVASVTHEKGRLLVSGPTIVLSPVPEPKPHDAHVGG